MTKSVIENGRYSQRALLLTVFFVSLAIRPEGSCVRAETIIGALGVLKSTTGLEPGDRYRLAFVTSTTRNASSTNIADYNAFVQTAADNSTTFPLLENGTWKVIGSTLDVSARDNTGTDPLVSTGVPIFLLDGTTKIADNNADLWDGSIDAVFNIDENGSVVAAGSTIFTGSDSNGTQGTHSNVPGQPSRYFGTTVLSKPNPPTEAVVTTGKSSRSDAGWMVDFNQAPTASYSFYSLSDELVVPVPEPASLTIAAVALFTLAAAGRRWRRL